jgi:hypothetical protein
MRLGPWPLVTEVQSKSLEVAVNAKTLTKQEGVAREPLLRATVALQCDACGEQLTDLPLATASLASALFRLRKEHAKVRHNWREPC